MKKNYPQYIFECVKENNTMRERDKNWKEEDLLIGDREKRETNYYGRDKNKLNDFISLIII